MLETTHTYHAHHPVVMGCNGTPETLSLGTPDIYGILQTTVQMLLHFLDFGMHIQEAIEVPHFRYMDHTFRTLFVGSSMDFRVAPFANPALAVDTLCPEVLESCPLWPLVTLVSPWPA